MSNTPLKLLKISARRFQLLEDVELFGVSVPSGYITNGASVPRIFWFIMSPFTEGFEAAVVHDYRYYVTDISRSEADYEFLCNLQKCKVNFFRRFAAYMSVRLCGWLFWNEQEK